MSKFGKQGQSTGHEPMRGNRGPVGDRSGGRRPENAERRSGSGHRDDRADRNSMGRRSDGSDRNSMSHRAAKPDRTTEKRSDRPAGAERRRADQDRRNAQMYERRQMQISENAEENEDGEALESRIIEGRNAVLEAFRSGRTIDRLMIQDGCQDGPIQSIKREANKYDTVIDFLSKDHLDQISVTGKHQGVIAYAAAYEYAEVEDILEKAKEKGEAPFIFLLDNIEDPHNLGAIIRTANLAGAHGVIIPKRRAVGLTPTVARASAGALNYTPVARVTNIGATMEELKKEGIWFVCADIDGEVMYNMNLTGPMGVVIGNEGDGVSRLVKEKCDFVASIPMKGDIDSLNASVAAGVLAFEIVRQRNFK